MRLNPFEIRAVPGPKASSRIVGPETGLNPFEIRAVPGQNLGRLQNGGQSLNPFEIRAVPGQEDVRIEAEREES